MFSWKSLVNLDISHKILYNFFYILCIISSVFCTRACNSTFFSTMVFIMLFSNFFDDHAINFSFTSISPKFTCSKICTSWEIIGAYPWIFCTSKSSTNMSFISCNTCLCCSLFIFSFFFFFAKMSCRMTFFSKLRLVKSHFGISMTSSRLTIISKEFSFIYFPLLLFLVLLPETALVGVGDGVSPLGLVWA